MPNFACDSSTRDGQRKFVAMYLDCPMVDCKMRILGDVDERSENDDLYADMHRHFADQHGHVTLYRCHFVGCGTFCPTPGTISGHASKVHKNQVGPGFYQCCACPQLFKAQPDVTNHFKDVHRDGQFQCHLAPCDSEEVTFSRMKDAILHFANHHAKKRPKQDSHANRYRKQ